MPLLEDFQYAARMMRKHPAITLTAAITLALGIGANTAIFSVVDTLLWKPIPYRDSERLVQLFAGEKGQPKVRDEFSPGDFHVWKSDCRALEHAAAWEWDSANLSGTGEPERVQGFRVTSSLFRALAMQPLHGRTLVESDEEEGKGDVVVLSHGLWVRRFGADPSWVGRTIKLDGRDHIVAGVMPAAFNMPVSAQLWRPLVFSAKERQNHGSSYLQGLARIRDGYTFGQARIEMESISKRLAEQLPDTNRYRVSTLLALRDGITGDYTMEFSLLLLGAVSLVLLIACANVANLQLAYVTSRQREISVRAALGASRWSIVRLLLAESVLRAAAGAVMGLLMAFWAVDVIRVNMPPKVMQYIFGWQEMGIDWRAFAFALGVSLFAGVVSGLAPALYLSRADLHAVLKDGGRASTAGRSRSRTRSVFVVAQVTLAVVLLIGTGLIVKGFGTLVQKAERHQPETVLTFRVTLAEARYKDAPQRNAFWDHVMDRFRSRPGIEQAALVSYIPYGGASSSSNVEVEGLEPAPRGASRWAQLESVSPDYLKLMRVPLIKGRPLSRQDSAEAAKVVVVSQAFVDRYLKGQDPIGRRMQIGNVGPEGTWWTIAGVAGDVMRNSIDPAPRPTVYRTYWQAPRGEMTVMLRTAGGDPSEMASLARAEVQSYDRDQPIYLLQSFQQLVSEERVGLTYVAVMMSVLGVLAVVLASVGMYAMLAHLVTERTHEIGVRMALGAATGDVLRLVVGRSLMLASVGLALGLAGGMALARAFPVWLLGTRPSDVPTFAAVVALLALVAGVATWLPARRAARVDPMVALRYE